MKWIENWLVLGKEKHSCASSYITCQAYKTHPRIHVTLAKRRTELIAHSKFNPQTRQVCIKQDPIITKLCLYFIFIFFALFYIFNFGLLLPVLLNVTSASMDNTSLVLLGHNFIRQHREFMLHGFCSGYDFLPFCSHDVQSKLLASELRIDQLYDHVWTMSHETHGIDLIEHF